MEVPRGVLAPGEVALEIMTGVVAGLLYIVPLSRAASSS